MANTFKTNPQLSSKLEQLDNDSIFLLEAKHSLIKQLKEIERELAIVEQERVKLIADNKLPWFYRLWQ